MDADADFSDKYLHITSLADDFNHNFLVNMSDDEDIASKVSLATADYMDFLSKCPHTSDLDDFYRWVPAIYVLISHKLKENPLKRFPFIKADDWHADHVYHAVLQSLELVINQLRHPTGHQNFNLRRLTESICMRVLGSFDSFCGNFFVGNCWHVVQLKETIIQAAKLAEDVTNSHLDKIQFPDDRWDSDSLMISWLKTGMLDYRLLDSIEMSHHSSHLHDGIQVPDDDLVGLSDDLRKIKEQLILNGTSTRLQIIPIIGMGGIGKTTLTNRVFDDPQIKYHFHVRARGRVSQEYHPRNVLLDLLESIEQLPEEVRMETKEDLESRLSRRLSGYRYLIVLDDIWTTKTWDDMRICFPDNMNGSRIILTSRLAEVAAYASSDNPPHFMNFLGSQDSWKLLSRKVFVKDTNCPPELEDIGEQIAKKCLGLPLAILVVAGHLSQKSKTRDCWENVAKGIDSLLDGSQEQFFSILSLSYNDLPPHLKKCFLYMGTFPKNSEIPVQKLICLWAAAGFLDAECPSNLEKFADKCLKELISRSLIIVRKRKFDGGVKTCGLHDLLWDLILREAQKEGENIFGQSLSSLSYSDTGGMKYLMDLTHTFIYFQQSVGLDSTPSSISFELLTVLDVLLLPFVYFPEEITELVCLRYLALSTYSNIPGSVSNLRNLETLINDHRRECPILPEEIWLLPHLRHLHVGVCAHLPDPSTAAFEGSCASNHLDLQTLSRISSTSCTKEVFEKIHNLKQLWIHEIGNEMSFDLHNLVHLNQLEKLKLFCSSKHNKPQRIRLWGSFLPNIKQLTLLGTHLQWEEMNHLVAMLPKLEVLKLKKNSFCGHKWAQIDEGIFRQLKILLLESLNLHQWKASGDHFPILECLVIRDCASLHEIPDDIGEIPTLKLINLECCNYATALSARRIQMKQLSEGNENLRVRIGFMLAEGQFMCLTVAFIYMTSRLKKQWAEHDARKVKKE